MQASSLTHPFPLMGLLSWAPPGGFCKRAFGVAVIALFSERFAGGIWTLSHQILGPATVMCWHVWVVSPVVQLDYGGNSHSRHLSSFFSKTSISSKNWVSLWCSWLTVHLSQSLETNLIWLCGLVIFMYSIGSSFIWIYIHLLRILWSPNNIILSPINPTTIKWQRIWLFKVFGYNLVCYLKTVLRYIKKNKTNHHYSENPLQNPWILLPTNIQKESVHTSMS